MTIDGQPVRILLAEDNPDHAELVLTGLRDLEFPNEIVHVSDGEEALDYLFRRGDYADPAASPRPQLILLDLRMPKVDGLEVLRQVKTADDLKQIPVVVLTTSDAETDVLKAYDYHANSYLVKPLYFDEFTKMLRDVGFYWLVWNRSATL